MSESSEEAKRIDAAYWKERAETKKYWEGRAMEAEKLLRSIVADVEAMKCKMPRAMDSFDVEGDQEHWFGGFEIGWWDPEHRYDQGHTRRDYYIQWTNLDILIEQAKKIVN